MADQSYFQLISPLVFLVFAVGFACIWSYARELNSARWFALSYFMGAVACTIDFFVFDIVAVWSTYAANIPYLVTATTFSGAVFLHYGRRAPWGLLWTMTASVLTVLTWYRLVDDTIVMRTLAMTLGAAGIFAVPLVAIRDQWKSLFDRILYIVLWVNVAQMVFRTTFMLWLEGATISEETYSYSLLAMSFHFAVATIALATAVLLFVSFGMGIVTRLTQKSETDTLTGTFNRAGFDSRLEGFATALSTGVPSHALVITDIDHFKGVNDIFGHEAGDCVIRAFAEQLGAPARDSDIVVRWGGEEFVVVLFGADENSARLYAESVRCQFAAIRHDCTSGQEVTASFGIAEWPAGMKFREVYIRADAALYAAKEGGRNRVRMSRSITAKNGLETAVA